MRCSAGSDTSSCHPIVALDGGSVCSTDGPEASHAHKILSPSTGFGAWARTLRAEGSKKHSAKYLSGVSNLPPRLHRPQDLACGVGEKYPSDLQVSTRDIFKNLGISSMHCCCVVGESSVICRLPDSSPRMKSSIT